MEKLNMMRGSSWILEIRRVPIPAPVPPPREWERKPHNVVVKCNFVVICLHGFGALSGGHELL